MKIYIDEITEIWKRLLQKEEIGQDDNFFAMGGNSMTAMQLAVEIEKKYDIDLELQDLFDNQTINQLAALIEKKKGIS